MKETVLALFDSVEIGESLITASADKIGKSSLLKDISRKIEDLFSKNPKTLSTLKNASPGGKFDIIEGLQSLTLGIVLLNALYSHILEKGKETPGFFESQTTRHKMADRWGELITLKTSLAALLTDLGTEGQGNAGGSFLLARYAALSDSAFVTLKSLSVSAGETYGFSHVCGLLDKVGSLLEKSASPELKTAAFEHISSLQN